MQLCTQSWVGHPCFDLVDNSTGFEEKIHRVIEKVCERMRKRGIELHTEDRLKAHSKKRKFLIKSLPDEKVMTGRIVSLGSALKLLVYRSFLQSKTLMFNTTTSRQETVLSSQGSENEDRKVSKLCESSSQTFPSLSLSPPT